MKDLKNQKIFKNFAAIETKVADNEPRTLVVKISTPTPDRSKDTVQPNGMNADNFLKNPVVMFAHNYADMPIAKCTGLKVQDTGILATVQFPDEGTYDKADTIYKMYKDGFLSAWSIGFMPMDYEENEQGGYNFKSWELFEFSSVPVPDNPEALTVMRSKGINVDAVLEKKEENSDEPKEAKPESDEPTKAADDETEPYTDDTKITDLTVGDLKDIIEDVLENGDTDDDETKQIDSLTLKTGRTISGKHEGLLQEACDHMDKAAEQVKTVLSSVASDDQPANDEKEDDKSVTTSGAFFQKLANSLKTNNQKQDLTLRLLKTIVSERGGDKND